MRKLIFTLILASAALFIHAQDPNKKDQKFVMAAAKDGLLEVKLGELAQNRGTSEEVKQLGKMMQEDHTKANAELKSLALSKGILIPNSLDPKAQKKYDELAAIKGAEFDKAYCKLMVKEHKKDIAVFKKESKKGSDVQMKEWAGKTLTKLEHHLEMSKQACDKIKEKS